MEHLLRETLVRERLPIVLSLRQNARDGLRLLRRKQLLNHRHGIVDQGMAVRQVAIEKAGRILGGRQRRDRNSRQSRVQSSQRHPGVGDIRRAARGNLAGKERRQRRDGLPGAVQLQRQQHISCMGENGERQMERQSRIMQLRQQRGLIAHARQIGQAGHQA